MTILEQCFRITVGSEGGLSLDPQDKGNWTGGRVGVGVLRGSKYGVSAASYPDLDIVNLTLADAAVIFGQDYFKKAQCDLVPGPLACLLVDAAYNHGPARPRPWLQAILGVHQDGIIGPQTLRALEKSSGAHVMTEFQAARLRFMASLDSWPHNAGGWSRRLFVVYTAALYLPEKDPS